MAFLKRGAEQIPQQHRHVDGLAAGAVFDLVAAGEAVGHDHILRPGRARRRQQREFRHFSRGFVVFGLETERSGHAAAAGLDQFELQPRHEPQSLAHRFHQAESLLVAMAVDVDLDPVARPQRQFQAAQQFARQKFLEQVQVLAERADLGAEAEAEEFVAHGQKA